MTGWTVDRRFHCAGSLILTLLCFSMRHTMAFSVCRAGHRALVVPNKSIRSSLPSSRRVVPSSSIRSPRQWMGVACQSTAASSVDLEEVERQIKAKGDEIRQLKADNIDKESLAPHIAELLALKAQLPQEEESAAPKPKKKKQPQKKTTQPQQQKKPEEMSESELRQARLAKVAAMREAGVEPYEYSYQPTHSAGELQALYKSRLDGGEEDEDSDVTVAGRIMARRVFGKLAFFTLQDETGTIQLQMEKKRLNDTFKVSGECVNITSVLVQSVGLTRFFFYIASYLLFCHIASQGLDGWW